MNSTRYRLLTEGEALLETDEFNYSGSGWEASGEGGHMVTKHTVGHFRRPLPALPEGVPPIKDGFLFYGCGPLLHPSTEGVTTDIAYVHPGEPRWDHSGWEGKLNEGYYAICAGTELARLNGLELMQDAPPTPPEGTRLAGKLEDYDGPVEGYTHSGLGWSRLLTWCGMKSQKDSVTGAWYVAVPLDAPLVPAVWTFRSEEPVLPFGSPQWLERKLAEREESINGLTAELELVRHQCSIHKITADGLRVQLDSIRQLLASR